jgi:hypothetical protein
MRKAESFINSDAHGGRLLPGTRNPTFVFSQKGHQKLYEVQDPQRKRHTKYTNISKGLKEQKEERGKDFLFSFSNNDEKFNMHILYLTYR